MLTSMSAIRTLVRGFAVVLCLGALTTGARAVPTVVIVTVNEHGRLIAKIQTSNLRPVKVTGSMQKDPGPGGLDSALTYASPLPSVSVTAGDLQLQDGTGGPIGDLIRFNATGTGTPSYPASLVFYSDSDDSADAAADTGLPTGRQTNLKTILEVGSEGANGATYSPVRGEPGFVANLAVTYKIISDPEPSGLLVAASGLIGLGAALRRRRAARMPARKSAAGALVVVLAACAGSAIAGAVEVKPGTPVPGHSKPLSLAINEKLEATLTVDGIATNEACTGPGDLIVGGPPSCSLGGNFVFSGDVPLTEIEPDVSDVLRFPRQVIMEIGGQKFWTADWAQMFSDTDEVDENPAPADIGIPAALTDALGAVIARTPAIQEASVSPTEYLAGEASYMIFSDGLCDEGGPGDAALREPHACRIPEVPGLTLFLVALAALSLAVCTRRRLTVVPTRADEREPPPRSALPRWHDTVSNITDAQYAG